ncbi:hypothetical protein BRC82_00575 [Halobacteriales archaeon QS_1_67_19]|nr:MAG: hypothetical protein BRC82_00575 [Halobacteriales archaeon QS_1_67_19]
MFGSLGHRFADADWFWERHANPASGWSRVPTGPLLVYAVYARNWRLLGWVLLFVVVNPVLFPRAEPADDERWITKGVRGERLWVRGVDAGRANLLTVASAPAFCAALYAAVRRNSVGTAVLTGLAVALKLAFVNEMAKLYDRERAAESG